MAKKTSEELQLMSTDVLCFLNSPMWDFLQLGMQLVNVAENYSPATAKNITQRICVESGLSLELADKVSKSCRFLAILRKYYPEEFKKAVKESCSKLFY